MHCWEPQMAQSRTKSAKKKVPLKSARNAPQKKVASKPALRKKVAAKFAGEAFLEPILKGRVQQIQDLLASGVSPNALLESGWTPLQFLVDRRSKKANQIARLLLDAGAKVDARPKWKRTALMMAAENGLSEIVQALLAAGADPHLLDNDHTTAIFYAVGCSQPEAANCLRMLLAAGLDPNEKWIPRPGVLGGTPILKAAENLTPAALRVLLEAGADPNVIGMFNWATALTSAIGEKKVENIALLLEAGADPHLRIPATHPDRDLAGKTAIEMAREMRVQKIAEMLEARRGNSH